MKNTIEPPVLLSRVLTFVLATAVVVLVAMVFTLSKMVPLERPEVFFLSTPTRSTNVLIQPLDPNVTDKRTLYAYQKGFIREYVVARNTLTPQTATIRQNWSKIVKPWSSGKVYNDFIKTRIYKQLTTEAQNPDVFCNVEFPIPENDEPILRMNNAGDTYIVKFTWICKNIGGQTHQKNYIIQIKIQSSLDKTTSGTLDYLDKLRDNPLGIQIVQYKVLDGQGNPKDDPLDDDLMSW